MGKGEKETSDTFYFVFICITSVGSNYLIACDLFDDDEKSELGNICERPICIIRIITYICVVVYYEMPLN